MQIVHNGSCTMYCNLLTDIRIAKETGYDGIEILASKLYRYLDQGFSVESVSRALNGFPVTCMGYIQDIERQQPNELDSLLFECDRMCSISKQLGSPMVQLLTGPKAPGSKLECSEFYKKILALPWPELRDLTANNLKRLAAIGAEHGIKFYLEPLRWAALYKLDKTLELLDTVGADNIGLVIDIWHMFAAGTKPDEIAELNKKLIMGVHFCDSIKASGESWTLWDRYVWTGGGVIPLKEWIDAILATGFNGWWSCELFSPKHWEQDPWDTARLLKDQLKYLLI